MLDLMKNTKGAISIFLVIVLLPMLSVAGVFVDSGRLKLANSMAESAGDLALNTALTNYDSELKTLYGLFATSQNMDELMESLEDYYRESIVAAGVDAASADDYVGQIMSYLKSTTGMDDIMKIELTGFEVSSPTGGNLGNPAILKSQVVEFMKYRAPLSLGTSFLDALSSMKNLSKQTTLVENKNKFYESYQDLLGALEDAWWQLELYQISDSKEATGFPTGSYVTDHASQMDTYTDSWEVIVSNTVKYLYNYQYFNKNNSRIFVEYACPECGTVNGENSTACSKSDCGTALDKSDKYKVWSVKLNDNITKCTSSYTEDNPASTDDILKHTNMVLRAIHNIDAYQTGKKNDIYVLVSEKVTTGSDPVAKIYAVCKFNEDSQQSSGYLKAVKDLLENMVQLQGALQTCKDENLAEYKINVCTHDDGYLFLEQGNQNLLVSFASSQIKAHYNLNNSGYIKNCNDALDRVNEYYDNAKGDFDTAAETVNGALDPIRDYAYSFDQMMYKKSENLRVAIELLNGVKNTLTNKEGAYYTNLEAWQNSADALSDDSMGKNDQAEIKELTSVVTEERVQGMINRLTKAKASVDAIRTEVAKYKFAGTSWKDIADNAKYIKVISMLSQWDGQIDGIKPTTNDAYDTVIDTILTSVEQGKIATTWNDVDHPDLTKNTVALYNWMYNNFYDRNTNKDYSSTTTDENKTTSADGDMDTMENGLKDQVPAGYDDDSVEASTKVNADIKQYLDAENKVLPSTRWPEVLKQIDSSAAITESKIPSGSFGNDDNGKPDGDKLMEDSGNDGVLESILNMASDLGSELRDTLYVSEYIMTMFSYDTIEAETFVENKKTGDTFAAFYEDPDKDGEFTVKDAYKEYAAEIKTLTNNSINPGMNYLYGEEVEYILYGRDGGTKVYATIFALRFGLNTVYAFTDAEITNLTLSAATALFGVPPLTPMIPFAQAAMIIGLAVAESAWDLVQLRSGEKVPLLKNNQTWVMKPSGIANEVKDKLVEVAEGAANKIIDEGYKVLNEAIEMTTEELQNLINEGEDGLNQLINAATETVTSQFQNYANEALQKVIDMCNDVNQQMMLEGTFSDVEAALGPTPEKVALVVEKLNAWLETQSGDQPAIYEVKKLAVDYLTANDGAIISELFGKIAEQSCADPDSQEEGGPGINNILYDYVDDIAQDIEDEVTDLIEEGGSALSAEVDKLESELKEAAAKGAEELKAKLKEQIGSAFDSVPTADGSSSAATDNAVCSLLSWAYSDYLRIFVVIGLLANEEAMILRMADMIELNMQNKNNEYALVITEETTTKTVTTSRFFGLYKKTKTETVTEEVENVNKKAFSLENSHTYLSIHATMEVKPLFLALPFMAPTVENEMAGVNWYEIEYSGMLGY